MALFAATGRRSGNSNFAAVAPCPEEHDFSSVDHRASGERPKPGNQGQIQGQRYQHGFEDQHKDDEEEARQRRKRELQGIRTSLIRERERDLVRKKEGGV